MIWKGTLDGNQARIAKDNLEASVIVWWLRSPPSATAFWRVDGNGNANSNYATFTGSWCRPVLNVASNTIVGVDESGNIYLVSILALF